MAVNVGAFRHRITIQRPVREKDIRSNAVTTWTDAFSCNARKRYVSSRDFFEAAAHKMEDVVTFDLRRRDGLSSGMRILHEGSVYSILQIKPWESDPRFLSILAKATRKEDAPYGH